MSVDSGQPQYANFGTVSGLQLDHESNADVGPSLWVTDVVGAGLGYKTWTIPGGVVQGWIDDPASFRGLLLFKAGNNPGEDLTFTSLENSQNMPAFLEYADGMAQPLPSEPDQIMIWLSQAKDVVSA